MPTNNNQIDKDNSAKTQKVALIRTHQEVRSGPIPSPSEMKQYSEVDSSLPNRIMAMAEKNSNKRMSLEKVLLIKEILSLVEIMITMSKLLDTVLFYAFYLCC